MQEGQLVEKGTVLYTISSEQDGEDAGAVLASISQNLTQRRESLLGEQEKSRQLHADEPHLDQKEPACARNWPCWQSNSRASSAYDNAVQRYQGLLDKGYISQDQFQQRQSEQLGQVQVLQRLRRERTSLEQQLVEQTNELSGLDSRQKNQLAQIDRQLSALTQELTESEARRAFIIAAPEAGVATAVLAEVGHSVDARLPLLLIVPTDSHLEAELYVPRRVMGFVQPGDPVNVRYQAYPYQKFGIYRGELVSMSRTSISPFELSSSANVFQGAGEAREPLYRLRVRLDSQAVTAYGKPQALQSGMLLEADILQESRRRPIQAGIKKRHLFRWRFCWRWRRAYLPSAALPNFGRLN